MKVYIWKVWLQFRVKGVLKFFNVYNIAQFALNWFVYVVWLFKSQLIWQLCKPDPNASTLDFLF